MGRIHQPHESGRQILMILVVVGALVMAACSTTGDPGPAGPAGPVGPGGPAGPAGSSADFAAADLSCTDCHNDTTMLSGKATAWADSHHGQGEAYVRGTSASCAGCHSGGAFSERVAAGLNPTEVEAGDPNPTRQDCRACHQVHTTFTGADWALEITDPVDLYAFEGVTYDGGDGNLCVQCHQPRRGVDPVVDGMIEVTSTHWGPHHGPQSAMLLGLAGAGSDGLALEGNPASHYTLVEGTCVTCHMGEGASHTYEPDVAACQACHADIEDFDFSGLQTEVQEKLDTIEAALVAKGWLDEEGHPVPDAVPAGEAAALWNWIYIAHEDGSLGVHNPAYTRTLLDSALASLGG